MATAGPRPQLVETEQPGFYRLQRPDLPGWRDVVDEALRTPDGTGPVPRLAFNAAAFIQRVGRLDVFLPPPDAALMHLAHPLMRRALAVLARRRYPGDSQVSRWTVRRGGLPPGVKEAIVLSVEELAVNGLRETFHNTVRTLAFPWQDNGLGDPLRLDASPADNQRPEDHEHGARILEDAQRALRDWLRRHQTWLTNRLREQLRTDGESANRREDARYRRRHGEISALIEHSTTARLTEELAQLAERRRQGQLFDEDEQLAEIERSIDE